MSARIVFAGGSKAMAHNLDDRYERWRLRRESMPEAEQKSNLTQYADLLVPTADTFGKTLEQCLVLRDTYSDIFTFLNEKETSLAADALHSKMSFRDVQLTAMHRKVLRYLKQFSLDQKREVVKRIKEFQGLEQASRDKMYIRWLRGSLENWLAVTTDEVARCYIEQILNTNYEDGDDFLFQEESA